MAIPAPLVQIRAQVPLISRKFPDHRVIGIKSNLPWQGDEIVSIDNETFRFYQCNSILQIRELLIDLDLHNHKLVIITPIDGEIGQDILARMAGQTLFSIRAWTIVLELFQARVASPNLLKKKWLAEALLEKIPPQGYPASPSGVLDEEMVWGIVLCDWLQIPSVRPDVYDLLLWSLNEEGVIGYLAMNEVMRKGIMDWVEQSAGEAGVVVFRVIESKSRYSPLSFALACQLVFSNESVEALRDAAVRIERYIGNVPIERIEGQILGDAASNLLKRLDSQIENEVLTSILDGMDQLLNEIGINAIAYLSQFSPQGLNQLLDRFGTELNTHLEQLHNRTNLKSLITTANALLVHYQLRFNDKRVARIQMAVRLLQWLETVPSPKAESISQAANQYIMEGGYVDWARYILSSGESSSLLSEAYSRLLQIVLERREKENRNFAELLATWNSMNSPGDSVLLIEDVLSKVVAPLAREGRVLLIVLDGMSMAVFHELLQDIRTKGWSMLKKDDSNWPKPVIAALPSVTEVSRASLLCGRLTIGKSSDEVIGFKSHPDLVKASRSGYPPLLFHKGNLTRSGGHDLTEEVREGIYSEKRRVVGIVVNAIDDHLAKGAQISVTWSLKELPVLEHLLNIAQESERIVVLTSDHGHILEHNTFLRKGDAGERFSTEVREPFKDELVVEGARVKLAEGNRLIASWSELVRYSTKKHGYHGGISPQECVVPLAILSKQGKSMKGWQSYLSLQPSWWNIPEEAVEIRDQQRARKRVGRERSLPSDVENSLPLFTDLDTQEIGDK
jgi:hypothetical protein